MTALQIGVITLFPEMLSAVTDYGVTGRAVASGQVNVRCWNPRAFTSDIHQTVDDRPYGGGPGMVMKPEPLALAIAAARQALGDSARVLALTPQGRRLDDQAVRQLAQRDSLILLAGRYEGIDERLLDSLVDEEWSIGDYVLSGGELPAMVLIDAVIRQRPGVLGHEDSAGQDSFVGSRLDCPHYTRPEQWQGRSVPEVLRSGNHEAIARWRKMQAVGRTAERRPDLLAASPLSEEEQQLLAAYRREQLAAE